MQTRSLHAIAKATGSPYIKQPEQPDKQPEQSTKQPMSDASDRISMTTISSVQWW